ncbi:MAG: hypothetical protein R3A11_05130 [Bdellovibrionota bacterium]
MFKNSNKRIFLRNPVIGSFRNAKVKIENKYENAYLVDWSYSGLGVKLSDHALKYLSNNRQYETEFLLKDQKLIGSPIHFNKDSKINSGFRILDPSIEKKHDPFILDDQEVDFLRDEKAIFEIFDDLCFKKVKILIQDYQYNQVNLVQIVKIDKAKRKVFLSFLESESRKISADDTYFLFFEIYDNQYFVKTRLKYDDKNFFLDFPEKIALLLRRKTSRLIPSNDIVLVASELSLDPIKVEDFSEQGISISTDSNSSSIPKGISIKDVTLQLGRENTKIIGSISARSFHNRLDSESSRFFMGFQLDVTAEPDRSIWHNFVLMARYNNFDFNYRKEDHESIWTLFEDSHLTEKNSKFFARKKVFTVKTWDILSDLGTKFSRRVMIRRNEKIVGHVQIDKLYSKTWCIHHLAVDPFVSKLIAKNLYSIIIDILIGGDAQYLFNFTNSKKQWNKRSYYDFVDSYERKEHNEIELYQKFLVQVDDNFLWAKRTLDKSVSEINKYDQKKILKYFKVNKTEMFRDACDLNEDELFFSSLSRQIEKSELKRVRKFFVHKDKKGKVDCFVRAEASTGGINVFDTYNIAYFYPVVDLLNEDIVLKLTAKCIEFYKTMGVDSIMIAIDPSYAKIFKNPIFEYFCVGASWISVREVLSKYQSFSKKLYGQIECKKERIKSKIRARKNELRSL